MRLPRILVLSLSLLIMGAAPSLSRADDSCYGGIWGLNYGYGFSGTLYGLGFVPVPPYFALHPPVYYGERFERPYGVSPFACRCQLQPASAYHPTQRTPFIAAPARNPHCEPIIPEPPQEEGKDQMAAAAQWITNPFYQPAGEKLATVQAGTLK